MKKRRQRRAFTKTKHSEAKSLRDFIFHHDGVLRFNGMPLVAPIGKGVLH